MAAAYDIRAANATKMSGKSRRKLVTPEWQIRVVFLFSRFCGIATKSILSLRYVENSSIVFINPRSYMNIPCLEDQSPAIPSLPLHTLHCFKGVECGSPPNVTNTNQANEATVSGSTAHYKCLPGFMYKAGDNVKICSDNGTWEGEDLLCQGTCISSL